MIALSPDVLLVAGPQAAVALKPATEKIPIVFVGVGDPVGIGLVQSLPRPGGNITGFTTVVPEDFLGKRIERNPPGTGSWRLENCDPGQSGQPNSQAAIRRRRVPAAYNPEAGRGSVDS
jgi:hypothetical protein